jgi:collagenase-like PrtC family protease
MKILSCITNIKEIELLKKEGVDELYFGLSYRYIPNYGKFGNIKTLNESKKIINESHKIGLKAYLAANGLNFGKKYDSIIKYIKEMIDSGIDGIIVTDLFLLKKLEKYNIPLHISSVASVFNTEHLRFLHQNFTFSRIILPAQLSYNQAAKMIDYCKKNKIETEVFFFKFFGCPYINSNCFLHDSKHINSHKIKCNLQPIIKSIENINLNRNNEIMKKIIFERMNCSNFPRIFNAASFFDFYINGVEYTKYGTRTDDTKTKIKKVKFIKFAILYIESLLKKYNIQKAKEIFSKSIDELGEYIWKKE